MGKGKSTQKITSNPFAIVDMFVESWIITTVTFQYAEQA